MEDLITTYDLPQSVVGHLTSAVQFGFITGTLIFAFLTIADRFSPSKVFFVSAILGALFNLGIVWEQNSFFSLMIFRSLTGFFLAGIYPVGMKIAADYYREGLGKSLGYLVGALVIGTAFPHLAKDLTESLNWELVMYLTSGIATLGGVLMLVLVPNGPFRKPGQKLEFTAFLKVFKNASFRSAALGYFGHMWELYAFWAFIPLMLKTYSIYHPGVNFNISLISFLVIGSGGVACVIGGYLSMKYGAGKTAATALASSGFCCLISPLLFQQGSAQLFILFLFIWGLVVIADSPLFSTLVAHNAPPESKGTALTIVNCIGFTITIVSLQVISLVWNYADHRMIYMLLALGPVLGLLGLRTQLRNTVEIQQTG